MMTLTELMRPYGGKATGDFPSVQEVQAANVITPAEWETLKAEAKARDAMRLIEMRRAAAKAAENARHDRMAEEWEASHAQQRGA